MVWCIVYNLSDTASIDIELKGFFGSFNSWYPVFRGASPMVLNRLLYARSSTFYGCQLWNCASSELNRIRVAWNNAVRKICCVQKRSHVGTMFSALSLLQFLDLWRLRKLSFLSKLLCSRNSIIRYISSVLQYSARSSFSLPVKRFSFCTR